MRTVGYLNITVRRDKQEGEYKIENDEENLELLLALFCSRRMINTLSLFRILAESLRSRVHVDYNSIL